MKLKSFYILLAASFLYLTGNAGIVEKVYYFDQPVIERSGEFSVVSFEGAHLFGEQGKATLPFYPVSLLLPPGEVATSLEIVFEDLIKM